MAGPKNRSRLTRQEFANVISPRVPGASACITHSPPRTTPPLLRSGPDLSPLSVPGQCRCPGQSLFSPLTQSRPLRGPAIRQEPAHPSRQRPSRSFARALWVRARVVSVASRSKALLPLTRRFARCQCIVPWMSGHHLQPGTCGDAVRGCLALHATILDSLEERNLHAPPRDPGGVERPLSARHPFYIAASRPGVRGPGV